MLKYSIYNLPKGLNSSVHPRAHMMRSYQSWITAALATAALGLSSYNLYQLYHRKECSEVNARIDELQNAIDFDKVIEQYIVEELGYVNPSAAGHTRNHDKIKWKNELVDLHGQYSGKCPEL